jgi:phospho-N-acetylmuramoyl-pentapeptide-transferase
MVIGKGFQSGDKLLKINNFPIENFPDGAQYPFLATYQVERKVIENEQEKDKLFDILIPESQRYSVAREIFGPKDKNFVYRTNLPMIKGYVFDYSEIWFFRDWMDKALLGKIMYVLVAIFIVTAVSNGVNMTDGIDGLAAGTSAIVGTTLGLFAYISGNAILSNYLNISYIPLSAELIIYAAALVGACVGFLWYNTHPAEVFMGDTGSLALGGAIAVMALMVKKELLLPIMCGIFFVENLSVILQVGYFKYQKRRHGIEYAKAHRLFKMAPLHHHFEKGGTHEAKITMRFFIVCILLCVLSFATLKLR